VNGLLAMTCRAAMWIAIRLVPPSERQAWIEDRCGRLWRWMLAECEGGAADSRRALAAHTGWAFLSAVRLRIRAWQAAWEQWTVIRKNPWFPAAAWALVILAITIATGGFRASRRLATLLPYPEPDRVVILSQGPPYFGIRLGFLEREIRVLRRNDHTLHGLATYGWRKARIWLGGANREVAAANVSPEFFRLLGIQPSLGKLWADDPGVYPREFMVSREFFKRELHGDATQIGRTFQLGGQAMTLAGVLPKGFWFLTAPPAIWTANPEQTVVSPENWRLGLRGVVARTAPGASISAVEAEMKSVLKEAGMSRANFGYTAMPAGTMVYQGLITYTWEFAILVSVLLAWAAVNWWRDRTRGFRGRMALRFWSFFAAKSFLPLLAIYLLTIELSYSQPGSVSPRVWWGSQFLSGWLRFLGAALVFFWAWRDQRGRCRECLRPMEHPLRIGTPGRVLLDPAGQELMCPLGHGSVYSSESVLGSEMSDRWLRLNFGGD
jgi:hypothetical protein